MRLVGEDKLLIEEFDGWEGVSQQFAFHLRAVSTGDSLPLEDLLNEPVVVSLRMVHDAPVISTASSIALPNLSAARG